MDALTAAVVETGRHAAGKDWGQPPQLYALAKRAVLDPLSPGLPPEVRDASEDSLIPIEQDALPEGQPADVLASVHWPNEVAGCALVTEVIMLPQDARKDAPDGQAATEKWATDHPKGHKARLTVGVLRDGRYACCLQLHGEEELVIGESLSDATDDVVAALLGTF